jgi:uncharacterized protein YndB with AHSA1/START domain
MLFLQDTFKISTPTDLEILVERDFHAPRPLVWDAFTKPEIVRRWLLGPDGWTMPICEIDLRVGGRYRYVWRKESKDMQMAMGGEFREISAPEKLVATEAFEETWYAGEALDTTVFEEHGEITKMRLTVRYQSKEARDMASRSGMEKGMIAGYDRLEQMMASMRAAV